MGPNSEDHSSRSRTTRRSSNHQFQTLGANSRPWGLSECSGAAAVLRSTGTFGPWDTNVELRVQQSCVIPSRPTGLSAASDCSPWRLGISEEMPAVSSCPCRLSGGGGGGWHKASVSRYRGGGGHRPASSHDAAQIMRGLRCQVLSGCVLFVPSRPAIDKTPQSLMHLSPASHGQLFPCKILTSGETYPPLCISYSKIPN